MVRSTEDHLDSQLASEGGGSLVGPDMVVSKVSYTVAYPLGVTKPEELSENKVEIIKKSLEHQSILTLESHATTSWSQKTLY